MRQTYSTNTPSEQRVGYSRAVRVDNTLYISGTTSTNEKGIVVGKTVAKQTDYIFQKIIKVIQKAGFKLEQVAIVRVYLVDMKGLAEFDAVFLKWFGFIKPACTLVGVCQLVDRSMLLEVEVIVQK